jgi:hypothetical protein
MREGFMDTGYKGNTGHCVWPVRDKGNLTLWDITVVKTGSGQGSVVSDPSGINSGTDCETQTSSFAAESDITLTATAPYGSRRCEKIGFCIRNLSAKTQIGLGQELTDHEECMSVPVMD